LLPTAGVVLPMAEAGAADGRGGAADGWGWCCRRPGLALGGRCV